MKATNRTSGKDLANDLTTADSVVHRMKGMLGRKAFYYGEGLWIKRCKGVHSFGMKFPIDVVFLDRHLCVIAVVESLPPNRLTPLYFRASSVLELPSGKAEETDTVTGDFIVIT